MKINNKYYTKELQTHPRVQIHNMLTQTDVKPPQIDIPDFITYY